MEKELPRIDDLDLSIIRELQNNADRPIGELAKVLGKHESTIRSRVDNLIESQAIRIVAVPSTSLDPYRMWALIGINVAAGQWQSVAEELTPHVYSVFRTLGRFDILCIAYWPSFGELQSFICDVARMTPGVVRAETIMIKRSVKLVGLNVKEIQGRVDELDLEIIRELQKRADRPSAELAKILGKHQSTIRRRIVNLIESQAIRIVAVPSLSLEPYRTWAAIGITIAPGQSEKVAQALASNGSLYTVFETMGHFDVLTLGYWPSVSRLGTFIDQEIHTIPGVIGTETLMIPGAAKMVGQKW